MVKENALEISKLPFLLHQNPLVRTVKQFECSSSECIKVKRKTFYNKPSDISNIMSLSCHVYLVVFILPCLYLAKDPDHRK